MQITRDDSSPKFLEDDRNLIISLLQFVVGLVILIYKLT